ncbi:GNAT family N-acetyltransferase [Vibrio tapetis]|uniref:Acetyltransferase, GNAT family protein n=1 Tax=Vibrio tapetis subsp. tapetis TaxID=1671868 RepID=A0A2N8Z995_9VIBR|nr:GNAT family N-acetyltransferase [Vibrio tapetis]SON48470.1 Acetyltransferase, GNAT family protein [Vibrio tapetis subsp. tapetis]
MNITCEAGTIDHVIAINHQIPEFDDRTTFNYLASRLTNTCHLILIAKVDDVPVAYKIGYALSDSEFYSWLGGVVPRYRKQGIATILRENQESWAFNSGYSSISVKSMNQYPAMLQLLISSGYQINGYEDNGTKENSKIQFIKTLLPQRSI